MLRITAHILLVTLGAGLRAEATGAPMTLPRVTFPDAPAPEVTRAIP